MAADQRRLARAERRARNRRTNKRNAKIFAVLLLPFAALIVISGVVASIEAIVGHDPTQSRGSGVATLVFWLAVGAGLLLLARWRLRVRRARRAMPLPPSPPTPVPAPVSIAPPPPAPASPRPAGLVESRLERSDVKNAVIPRQQPSVPPRLDRSRARRSAEVLEPFHLCIDGYVSVVGESFYQPALKVVAKGGMVPPRALEKAIPAIAALAPDPANPHDRNAVRVEIDGHHVGHLSRDIAPEYQPILRALKAQGRVGVCPARIMGGGDRYYGVHLHLSEASLLLAANQPDGLDLWQIGTSVAVTGGEAHQDVLRSLLPPQEHEGAFAAFASLHTCAIAKGARRGERTIEVRIGDQRIGELTKLQADRHLEMLNRQTADGRRPGCQVYVREGGARGLQAKVLLPKVKPPSGLTGAPLSSSAGAIYP